MYEAFFGLREKPFSLLPDPSFLFLSQQHQEALTLLEYGLLNQAGFIVLTGEIGAGKTTLMRYLLHRLDTDVTVGLISHTHQSLGELMEWICLAFDIRIAGGNKLDQHHTFLDFLIDQYAKGKRVLLIVDEAQNLGVEKLEELRLLSNINADKDLVLQIMLLGQPQLRKLLQHADLEQFVQRVAASYHLGRLNALETERYIQHRIFIAGGQHEIFTRDACHAVHHYSNGVPRLINLICDTAMVHAYGGGDRRITGATIDEFVAAHAPHLLIPIERDEAARPLPRERLHQEDAAETDERTPTARTPDLVAGPQVPLIEDQPAESSSTDDRPWLLKVSLPDAPEPGYRHPMPGPAISPMGHTREAPPLRAPDPPGKDWPPTQGRPIPPTAAVLHTPAAPLYSTEPQPVEAQAAASARAHGETVVGARSGLHTQGTDLPAKPAGVVETTERPHGKTPGRAIWVLAALVIFVATGLALLWFGGSSTSQALRSAVMERLPGDRSNDQTGTSRVAPPPADQVVRPVAQLSPGLIAEQPADGPERPYAHSAGTGSAPEQSPRQGLVPSIVQNTIGDTGGVALNPHATVPPIQTGDPKVQSVEASTPTSPTSHPASEPTPSGPSRSQPGDRPAPASDPTLDAPIAAGAPARSESWSSDTLAETTAPAPQIALPTSAPSEDKPAGAHRSPNADHDRPHADTYWGAIGQLERQFKGLSLEVERDADRLVANLGGSVQFPDSSAELDNSARDALRRVAEVLKDPLTARVRVIAHTDSSGNEEVNQWLSDLRARTVARYLAANGVSASRLTHQGRGKREPKVAVEQEQIQGPGINRRIELEVFEPDHDPE